MLKEFKKGFTLAEVLIVIGIIGVVAALTLPNLNHATGDKERVTKVKKIYAALTEAYDRAEAIYGPTDTWFNDLTDSEYVKKNERFAKRITEFMKISKDCGIIENSGCFSANAVKYLNDENTLTSLDINPSGPPVPALRFITSDNMSLFIDLVAHGIIYIDIDGPNKGKNQLGNDIFRIMIEDYTLNPCYTFIPGGDSYQIAQFFQSGNNALCWIINTDNADYLQADSTGKCNNSDIILDWTMTTNTSCH